MSRHQQNRQESGNQAGKQRKATLTRQGAGKKQKFKVLEELQPHENLTGNQWKWASIYTAGVMKEVGTDEQVGGAIR